MMGVLRVILLTLAGVLGALLALLLLILLCPARVKIALKKGDFFLWAGLGPVKLRLLPPKPKKEKKPRRQKAGEQRGQPEGQQDLPEGQAPAGPAVTIERQPEPPEPPQKDDKKGKKRGRAKKKLNFTQIKLTVQQLTEYIRLAVESMGKLVRLLTVRQLQIHAVVATGDAASTAMAFGSAAAALNLLLPWLERRVRVKKQDIAVDCAFDRQQSQVEFEIELSALVFQLVIVCVRAGVRFWKLYQENQEKAVSL